MLATLAMEVEEEVVEVEVEEVEVVEVGHKAPVVAVKTVLMKPLSAQSGVTVNAPLTR